MIKQGQSMAEQIELYADQDDRGVITIKDQHGRTVRGIVGVTVSAGCDKVTTCQVEFVAYRNGETIRNTRRRIGYHIDIRGPDVSSSASVDDTMKAIRERIDSIEIKQND